jgi:peptide/nickel transport system substrate-binding protein
LWIRFSIGVIETEEEYDPMQTHKRQFLTALLSLGCAVAVGACGSSSSTTPSSSTKTPAKVGGTVTFLYGTAPQSLDPGLDYTTQGAEINWLAYTGLTTYAHANGVAGTALIPGLATALPTVSDGGKTYTATLRKGLVYSNGQPVKASDFAYAIERALKIPWGGSGGFITPFVVGAAAFANGKAKTISGITTNDSTGQITIHLTQPYGAFDNVLAFPALAPIPAGTPFKAEPTSPPPGVGPYMATNIKPNVSFTAVPNPKYAAEAIPGIPTAKVTVNAKIDSNVSANALSVLQNSADYFDWADTVPGSLLTQIKSQAANRFGFVNLGGSVYYVFMNSQEKPFNNQLAREAVVTGLNEQGFVRIGSGTLIPACYWLPPSIPGHVSSSTCPYSNSTFTGNIAKAKALVKQSGMAGAPVTVWSQLRTPRQQWMTYYTQFLNEIGFKATQKPIADATYWTTIGNLSLHPQTGFDDWNMDFPNPNDFYAPLMVGTAIQKTNNLNFGEINDAHINSTVAKLAPTPSATLNSVAGQWQSLEHYVAQKAYVAVFGYQTFPKFASDRINYGAAIIQPEYGWDWTSFQLK